MKRLLAALAIALSAGPLTAADWPQWRGPNRDGKSAETGLLEAWPKSGPKLNWTFEQAGLGYSTPAVVGDVLYCMGGEKGQDEFLFALDVNTGKQLWKTPIGKWFDNGWGGGPRGTPAVDGDRVYGLTGAGDLACLDAKSGKVVWKKSFKKDLNGKLMSGWGYSESVLIDGDHLICSPGGEDGTLAALDKLTGAVKWRSQGLTDDASYSSVVISNACGVKQYVQLTGKGLAGVDAKSGKQLWYVEGEGFRIAVIPTPIVSGDTVFATTDYGAKCMFVRLSKSGDGVQATKVYSNKALENHHGGVILHNGFVFGSHRNANQQKTLPFVCLEMETGKVAWSAEKKIEPSSIAYAQGHFYCYGQQTGTLVRVVADGKEFREDGRFTIPKESKVRSPQGAIWTHPVIANGKLYLRDQDLLFCYDLVGARAGK